MDGIELACPAGTTYSRARKDLMKKVSAIAGVANIPEIRAQSELKDLSVLQEPPFTDQGSIVEIFTDLSLRAGIRGVIDRINANAAA